MKIDRNWQDAKDRLNVYTMYTVLFVIYSAYFFFQGKYF